jgi:hypothetical protein
MPAGTGPSPICTTCETPGVCPASLPGVSAKVSSTSSTLAPLSPSMKAISGGASRVFSGTMIAPKPGMAYIASQ